ncbi:MAG: hypothetical protein KDB04_03150 [Acidimicrobiales bacterium]|nr:hypothetical protein [Acidimicrobiales bacterium]HRW38035.1 hypothetical protein [Aquihabitans sp.]
MTVIDLPRPAALRPASAPPRWEEPVRRPPSQFWCVRCARWHDRRDLGPDAA